MLACMACLLSCMILQVSHVTSMPTSKPASVLVAISHLRALLLKW